jgi:hypothetical protein
MTPPPVLRGTAPGGDPASSAVWLPTAFVRLAGASALVLLRLGEAATLAAAAGVRSVLDATQAPAPATPPVPVPGPPVAPVAVAPVAVAEPEPAAVAGVVAEPVADVVPLPVEPAPTSDVVLVQPEATAVAVPAELPVEDTDAEVDVEADTEGTDVEADTEGTDVEDVEGTDVEDVQDSGDTEDSSDTEEPEVDEPPVPLWDQLSLASIRGRLRRFSLDELHTLHAYETQHSNRPQVVAMLDKRIQRVEQLPAGASADTE